MSLSPSDIDKYIDSSVQGADRKKLHDLMTLLPSNMRGDVVYYDGVRAISNNPAVLPGIKIRPPESAPSSTAPFQQMNSQIRRSMTAGYCSPPDPYPNSGPYVREVGNCGFTSGWGIVNLECNSSHFYSNVASFPTYPNSNKEGGYMYFELTNTNNSAPGETLSEGGIFTQYGVSGESDIDPYITSNLGTLNNNSARYTCGTYIGVMSGLMYEGPGKPAYYYVSAGTIAGYNPSYAWQSTETVTMSNAAWIFEPAPGNGLNWGINTAGLDSACMQCGISKITSIADAGGTDLWDSSYFGVDPSTGTNAVYWPEIVFGVWTGCVNGGSSPPTGCTLKYSPDSTKWYAGQEVYPRPVGTAAPDAQSSFVQANGGWVYQSYDSVTAAPPSVGPGALRSPAGAFLAPTPGPVCTADSYGLCALNTAKVDLQTCYVTVWDSKIQDYIQQPRPYYAQYVYAVYRSTSLQSLATETITKNQDGCAITNTSWSPAEPRVTYNDPNLP